MITNRFSPENPVSCAQGRNGEVIIVQGNGIRPARSDLAQPARDAGMDPPTVAPTVTVNTTPRYYIARADVYKPGLCYYAPPSVTFASEKGVEPGKGRVAKASSFLSQSVVSEIRIDDGGKYYIDQPSVELSDTYGKGAVIEATLGGIETGSAGGDPFTGITQWKIVQAPPYLSSSGADDGLTWYYASGEATLEAASGRAVFGDLLFVVPSGPKWNDPANCSTFPAGSVRTGFDYTVSGGSGSGATFKVVFGLATFFCTSITTGPGGARSTTLFRGAREILSVSPVNYGKGYKDTDTVVIRIPSGSGDPSRDIIIHGVSSGNTDNVDADSGYVKSITIKNGGSGFLVAPQLKFVSNSGFGAFATCKVKNGKISSVTLESGGSGYKTPPTVEVVTGGAEAFAIARPHLRGKYQCYYRYIDDTPKDRGGPVPSNLSPVLEVDAGDGAQSISWAVPQPRGRATHLELWRTTSNQATTLYRVATLALTGGPDGGGGGGGGTLAFAQQPVFRYRDGGLSGWYEATVEVSVPAGVTPTFVWQGKNTHSDFVNADTGDRIVCTTAWQNLSASRPHSFFQDGNRNLLLVSLAEAGRFPDLCTRQVYRCVVSATGHASITSDEITHPLLARVTPSACASPPNCS